MSREDFDKKISNFNYRSDQAERSSVQEKAIKEEITERNVVNSKEIMNIKEEKIKNEAS